MGSGVGVHGKKRPFWKRLCLRAAAPSAPLENGHVRFAWPQQCSAPRLGSAVSWCSGKDWTVRVWGERDGVYAVLVIGLMSLSISMMVCLHLQYPQICLYHVTNLHWWQLVPTPQRLRDMFESLKRVEERSSMRIGFGKILLCADCSDDIIPCSGRLRSSQYALATVRCAWATRLLTAP